MNTQMRDGARKNVETDTGGGIGRSSESNGGEIGIMIETEKYSNGCGQYSNEPVWRSSAQID